MARPSTVEASAATTSRRCMARQAATAASRPRRSAAATATRSRRRGVRPAGRPGRAAPGRVRAARAAAPVSSAVCTRRDQLGHQPALPVRPGGRAGGVRVGAGQRVQQVQGGGVADRLGDRGDGDRVAQVAAGGHVRQQQVQPDQLLDGGDVGRRQADPGGDLGGDRGADDAVVAGQALADVVQERADQQQVGPVHLAGVGGRLVGGLDQVPVQGEAVHRVVLRQAAHPGPLRQPGVDQAVPVAGLPGGQQARAGAEQRDQRGAGRRRPRRRQRRAEGGEPFAGGAGDRQLHGGGRGGHPQRQAGVRDRADRGTRQHQLAVLLDHVAGDRARGRRPGRRCPGGGRCAAGRPPARRRPGHERRYGRRPRPAAAARPRRRARAARRRRHVPGRPAGPPGGRRPGAGRRGCPAAAGWRRVPPGAWCRRRRPGRCRAGWSRRAGRRPPP